MSAWYSPVILHITDLSAIRQDSIFPSTAICLLQRFIQCNPFFIFFRKFDSHKKSQKKDGKIKLVLSPFHRTSHTLAVHVFLVPHNVAQLIECIPFSHVVSPLNWLPMFPLIFSDKSVPMSSKNPLPEIHLFKRSADRWHAPLVRFYNCLHTKRL